ncbi:MAG: Ig-like domain-containing protein [Nannocystaceae bacterium]|nr:Ig-like domain-containing protein [Nannocystaceae bacterium]
MTASTGTGTPTPTQEPATDSTTDPSADSTGDGETTDSGDSTDSGTDSTGEQDTTPPEVLSIAPAHGSTNVIDEPVTLTFSEPMDTASFEAAFPVASDFQWADDDTTVQFLIPFPFSDATVLYDVVVPTSVQDVAGNGLEDAFTATLGLAALASITLEYSGGLTGNIAEGGTAGTFFRAGDHSGDGVYYGGISFALDVLPEFDGTLGVYSATYRSQVISVSGDPNDGALDGIVVDHVQFDSRSEIEDPTVFEAAFYDITAAGDLDAGDAVAVQATQQLQAAWSGGEDYFQLRLRASEPTENATADFFNLRRGADENNGIVAKGVADPDEDNRSRVVIEYFVP